MDDQDRDALVKMVREYSLQEIVEALKEVAAQHIDELIDMRLNDKAKKMMPMVWHFDILE